MSWLAEISALRREVRTAVAQLPTSLFGWTLTAKSSPIGDEDEAETADGTGEQRPVRRLEPWGHRGRPPSKVRSFWVRLGASNVLFVGIAPNKGYGPSDLEDGETALYSAEVPNGVRLTSSGEVKLESKTGQTVQINGADYSLLKTEDLLSDLDTLCTHLMTWVPLAVTGISTPMVGSAPDPGVVSSATSIKAKIASGAYKSTKAKNG